VFERTLRTFAFAATVFVIAGWAAFAFDETRGASDRSRAEIAGSRATSLPDPSPEQEREREHDHSRVREWVDDVNDVLLKPFAFAVDGSQSRWVRRSGAALLALLAYGFGAAYVARFARGRA
jgi:hypothetical protein